MTDEKPRPSLVDEDAQGIGRKPKLSMEQWQEVLEHLNAVVERDYNFKTQFTVEKLAAIEPPKDYDVGWYPTDIIVAMGYLDCIVGFGEFSKAISNHILMNGGNFQQRAEAELLYQGGFNAALGLDIEVMEMQHREDEHCKATSQYAKAMQLLGQAQKDLAEAMDILVGLAPAMEKESHGS